jgi:glycosyltransferase involved in cell wall biosynthesis
MRRLAPARSLPGPREHRRRRRLGAYSASPDKAGARVSGDSEERGVCSSTISVRVARVIAKLEPGGAQMSAFLLSAALRRHGVEANLLAGDATDDGIRVARQHGLEPECFRRRISGLQWTPSSEFAAWLAPRLVGADLVHAHMFGAWWAVAQVLEPGVPLVASEHNAFTWPDRPHHRELRDALPRVDRFFAHGAAACAYVRALGCPPERLTRGRSAIIGVDSRPLPELPSPRIVFAGRLERDKGPDVLVEALARLDDPVPAFILGDGGMRESLERRARELDVTFTGWQSEPGRWIAGAGVLVAPSRDDAWSQSVVLAMALGTPVIAAAVAGLPELLVGDRGVLVPPEDPDALAAAIADILAGRRRPDIDAARDYAAAFTPERMAEDYATAYRRLIRDAPDRSRLPMS